MSKNKLALISLAVMALVGAAISGAMMARADEQILTDCTSPFLIYLDQDDDGYGTSTAVTACNLPSGYSRESGDCNDSNANIRPGAAEICDGIDNDCDGLNDEGIATSTYYRDYDIDGYGDASTTMAWCQITAGYVANDDDCNDRDFGVKPHVIDVCDSIDNDCDGSVDEDCVDNFHTYYADKDSDGYGDAASSTRAVSRPAGFVDNDDDCNDGNAAIYPGRTEICDGIDNNCDSRIDENTGGSWYLDADHDGYGRSGQATTTCYAPLNYVSNDDDCNDNNASIRPGATEICDGIDNDCDGNTDENVQTKYFKDLDHDGYGRDGDWLMACSLPADYAVRGGDCDDVRADVHPTALELCDSRDNDCDGSTDENCGSGDTDDDDSDCACGCVRDCFKSCLGDCCRQDDDEDDNGNGDNGRDCAGLFRNHGQYVSCWAHRLNDAKNRIEDAKNKGQQMKEKAQEKVKDAREKAEQIKGKGKNK